MALFVVCLEQQGGLTLCRTQDNIVRFEYVARSVGSRGTTDSNEIGSGGGGGSHNLGHTETKFLDNRRFRSKTIVMHAILLLEVYHVYVPLFQAKLGS